MPKSASLPLQNGQVRPTINAFLRDMLDRRVVGAVLALMTHRTGQAVSPALVTDPSRLEDADVLAPVLPVNSARIVSALTRLAPLTQRTAVVLRPCEMRALVELVKLKQASLENLVVIGVDCPGTYATRDYARLAAQATSDDFVRARLQGKDDPGLRVACRVCEYPVPLTSDLTIGLFGADLGKGIILQANSAAGEELLGGLTGEPGDRRASAVAEVLSGRKRERDEFFARASREVAGLDNLSAILAPCNNCHNCMKACPVCYCRECFFDSPVFDVAGDRYLGMAAGRGAIKMPADTLLFHLTRMNHMAVSCVGCGCCEDACPNGVPLLKLFQLVGNRVQKLFDYVPGRSPEDELPLATFREDELQGVGEK